MKELAIQDEVVKTLKVNPASFEKDDDTNFHIDYIHAVANLRARNYKIPECERLRSKLIAGKIIPAIATTTAMITGCVLVELYKIAMGAEFEQHRNCFANLALPLWLFSEPMPPIRNTDKDYDPIVMGPVKAYPPNFTTWDKLEIGGPCTLQELLDKLRSEHKLNATIISSGKICLYNSYLPGGKHNDRLPKLIQDLYGEITNEPVPAWKHHLALEASCEHVDSDCDMNIPVIKYNF
jgi:ubiquitin-activating enzyme E1